MSRPPSPMRWGIRPRSRHRLWRRYAKRSRPSTTPGRGAPWAMSFSITCSWMLPFFRMHPGSPAEPILAAWGITTAGKPIFVGLAPSVVESTDAWANFLTDLTDRGLACPLLVVSDGAAGLIAAIEQIFPTALRQRCLIHRLRNVLARIRAGRRAEIRYGYWPGFDTADLPPGPGPRLVELFDARLGAFATRYAPTY